MPSHIVRSSLSSRSHEARSNLVPWKLHGILKALPPPNSTTDTGLLPAIGFQALSATSWEYEKSSTNS